MVERFERNPGPYKQGKYNETQVRLEFINPFFEELGWGITNKNGYAEACKEVVHEDAVKVGGATKAPDYSFRIGGVRRFFVEAKKPSVSIKEDTHPAYQLCRYAWSAKLPLSILTDFKEFAVYEDMYRINVFDWQSEFPEIINNGGFDAVIGNPPYVRQELLGKMKSYFERHYNVGVRLILHPKFRKMPVNEERPELLPSVTQDERS